MTAAYKKANLQLLQIALLKSHFEVLQAKTPEGEQRRATVSVRKDFPVVEDERHPVIVLTIEAKGIAGEIECWKASSSFLGIFEFDADGPLALEAAKSVNMPAVLYGFAREHIADLARRSRIGDVLLPLLNFAEAEREPRSEEQLRSAEPDAD